MNRIFITACTLLTWLLWACHSGSRHENAAEDSLQYYPPTPVAMEKNEFRNYYRQLSGFFDTTLLDKGFNGGILVARNGQVLYEKYQGLTDLGKKDSIRASSSLHIASTSKTFTAVAVLRMVQEKKLSLDDSLQRFFPGFPYPGITVKMLLNHRSGLPNYLYFMSNLKWGILPNKKWNHQYASNQDVLNVMMKERPDPTAPPGKRFNYSNTNYLLLALVIEKISGQSFPEYMQQHLFGPLQMKNTFVFTLKDTLTAIPSFTNGGTRWDYDFLDATVGDKNIYTTPRDLLKWDEALYTDQVLGPALKDSAFAPYSFERPGVHNYGLGWRLQLLPNGKKVVYHFGKWHGFNAAFARLTDEKATIIILGNKFNRAIYEAAHLCYDIFGDYQQRKVTETDDNESGRAPDTTAPAKKPSRKKR